MSRFRKDARGSATVEMAVLMPIILILMILLIYMALYLYDRSVLYGDAYLAALRASALTGQTSDEVYVRADTEFTGLQEGQLIAISEILRELTVDADGVRIAYGGGVVVPVMAESRIFTQWESYSFSGEAYAARHRPVTFIRRCRVLEKLLGGDEGNVQPSMGDGENAQTSVEEAEQQVRE